MLGIGECNSSSFPQPNGKENNTQGGTYTTKAVYYTFQSTMEKISFIPCPKYSCSFTDRSTCAWLTCPLRGMYPSARPPFAQTSPQTQRSAGCQEPKETLHRPQGKGTCILDRVNTEVPAENQTLIPHQTE